MAPTDPITHKPYQIPIELIWIGLAAIALIVGVVSIRLHESREPEQSRLFGTRHYPVFGGDLTERDLDEIETQVSKMTNDPIMQINVKGSGIVEVQTGVVRGPLDGGGRYFDFEKKDGQWVQNERNGFKSWVS